MRPQKWTLLWVDPFTQAQLAAKFNVSGWDVSRETLAKIESQIRWVADFEIPPLAVSVGLKPSQWLDQAIAKVPKRRPH
jgi:hypothetical protein